MEGFWQETAAGAGRDFQPLLFPLQRAALHHMTDFGALRRSETDLCDSKTKAARLPGTRVPQHGKQGAGAGERLTRRPSSGALPRCPGDLAPPPSASASGWTPRSSAPASGSPEPSGSAAPDGTKFTVIRFSRSSPFSHKRSLR